MDSMCLIVVTVLRKVYLKKRYLDEQYWQEVSSFMHNFRSFSDQNVTALK